MSRLNVFFFAFANLFLVSSNAMASDITTDLIIEQIGRFHFLVLHFPVVLIFLLPIVMFLSFFSFGKLWRKTIPYFVHLGTISAIIATVLGLLLAKSIDADDTTLMDNHRNLAFATCIMMLAQSVFILIKKPDFEQKVPKVLFVLAIVAFILLNITADLGGTLVHGKLMILFQ